MQFKAYSKFLLSNSQTLKEILTARLEDNPENFSEGFFDYCESVSVVDFKNEGYKLHFHFDKQKSWKEEWDDMIVVASLIEKIPNMGGLTRTCLTIGVSGLVIPSLIHIDSPEF